MICLIYDDDDDDDGPTYTYYILDFVYLNVPIKSRVTALGFIVVVK